MNQGSERAGLGEWECMECGYIEEGAETDRPQICPECGSPVQALEFFPYGEDEDDWEDESSGDLYEQSEAIDDADEV
jgi:hypothetical protein